jgi:hypothetical protein
VDGVITQILVLKITHRRGVAGAIGRLDANFRQQKN